MSEKDDVVLEPSYRRPPMKTVLGHAPYADLGPLPQLPADAAEAENAADGPAFVADLMIVRPVLAVEEHGAAEGEHDHPRQYTPIP